jgi:hypothetical protein
MIAERNYSFSPEMAQTLYDNEKISKSTYDASMGNQSIVPEQAINMSVPPEPVYGPPTPPMNDQGFAVLSQPPTENPFNLPLGAPSQSLAAPPVESSSPTPQPVPVSADVPEPKQAPAVAQAPQSVAKPEATRAQVAAGQAVPSAVPQKPKTAEQLERARLEGRAVQASDDAISEQQITNTANEAYQKGAQDSVAHINNTIRDEGESIKREEAILSAAKTKADTADADIVKRTRELANTKIDPNHHWESLSTGGKLQSAIGLFFGAFAGVTDPGKNPALDQFNKQIQTDIDAQKFNINNKKDALDMERNIVARQYARDQDWAGYERVKRLEGWRVLEHRLSSVDITSKSAQQQAAHEKGLMAIRQKADGARDEVMQYEVQTQKRKEAAAAQAAAAQRARLEKSQDSIQNLAKDLLKEKDKEGSPIYTPGQALAAAIEMHTGRSTGVQLPPTASQGGNKNSVSDSPSINAIGRLPEKQQTAALKELEDKAKWDKGRQALEGLRSSVGALNGKGAFDLSNRARAGVPGSKFHSPEAQQLESERKALYDAAKQITKGVYGEAVMEGDRPDIDRYVPSPGDSFQTIQSKLNSLEQMLGRAKPVTPILSSMPTYRDEQKQQPEKTASNDSGFSGFKK